MSYDVKGICPACGDPVELMPGSDNVTYHGNAAHPCKGSTKAAAGIITRVEPETDNVGSHDLWACAAHRRKLGEAMGCTNGLYSWDGLGIRARELIIQRNAATQREHQLVEEAERSSHSRNRLSHRVNELENALAIALAAKQQQEAPRWRTIYVSPDQGEILYTRIWRDNETPFTDHPTYYVGGYVHLERHGGGMRVVSTIDLDNAQVVFVKPENGAAPDWMGVAERLRGERDIARMTLEETREARDRLLDLLGARGTLRDGDDNERMACICGHPQHSGVLCSEPRCGCAGDEQKLDRAIRDLEKELND